MKKYLLIPIILAAAFIGLLPKAVSAQTLYQCFQENKMPWTTVKQRAAVAAENGVWQYIGTAAQNKLLTSRLCSDTFGFSAVTGYKSSLSLPMTSSQTSLTVVSLQTKDLHTITMSDLGSFVFLTLEPGGAKEELVKCTGISGSQFTGCTRGLAFYGTSTAAVAANAKTHNASSVVVLSNVHFVYEQFLDVNDKTQTIQGNKSPTGTWTFSIRPFFVTDTDATSPLEFITHGELSRATSTGGGVLASTSTKGVVQEATNTNMRSSTATGSTGARLFVPVSQTTSSVDYSGASAGMLVKLRNSDGELDSSFCGNPGSCAQLDSNQRVVQLPAAATSVPGTSSSIPWTTVSGTIPIGFIATSTGDGVKGNYLRSTSTGPFWGPLNSTGGASTTAGKGAGVAYRNTSTQHNGKMLLVLVTIAPAGGSGANGQCDIFMDSNSLPTTLYSRVYLNNNGGAGVSNSGQFPVPIFVPPNWYWYVVNVANCDFTHVYEMEL